MKLVIWHWQPDSATHLFWQDKNGAIRLRISRETLKRAIDGTCCKEAK
jgi:hypothetical protein